MKNALVIEDEFMTAAMIEEVLFSSHFENVFLAETGKESMEFLNDEKIDFITLDNQLPDIFGSELIKDIRAVNADADIVVLSSIKNDLLADKLHEYKIIRYIHKGNLIVDLNYVLQNLHA